MRKSGLDKEVMVLLITTLITAITWTGMEIYRAYKKNVTPEGVEVHLAPLSPQINTEVFEYLEKLKP